MRQISLKLVLAPRRSGSTLLMELLANHPAVGVATRVISRSIKSSGFHPDYSIFNAGHDYLLIRFARARQKHILAIKEETGDSRFRGTRHVNECNFPFVPAGHDLLEHKPVFLLREPCRTFDGWLKRGWSDIQSFIIAYRHISDSFRQCAMRDAATRCYVYEDLVSQPTKLLRDLCRHWEIAYSTGMENLTDDFASNFLFWSSREKKNYIGADRLSLFEMNAKSRSIRKDIDGFNLISAVQERIIARELRPLYEAACKISSGFLTHNLEDRHAHAQSSIL